MLKLLRISGELGTQNVTTDPVWPLKGLPSTMTWSWQLMISISRSGRPPSTHKNCLSIAALTPLAATILVERSRLRDLVSFLSQRLMVLMCGISWISQISLPWLSTLQQAPSLTSASRLLKIASRRKPSNSWPMVTRQKVLSICTRFLEIWLMLRMTNKMQSVSSGTLKSENVTSWRQDA